VVAAPGKALNALLLGESEARHLGVDVERLKRELVFCTALGVGAAVAAAGLIGFIGLVVPHLVRLLAGPDHRVLLPASLLAGGVLMLFADLARGWPWRRPSCRSVSSRPSLVRRSSCSC
jgi:iron complex transport system permease protein